MRLFSVGEETFFIVVVQPVQASDPCNPSPCGPNARCNNGICSCLPDYQGDPYSGCRPECVLNTDCPRTQACLQNKCKDPCPGTCGDNALCEVINHIPTCSCPERTTGNPFISCTPLRGKHLLHLFGVILFPIFMINTTPNNFPTEDFVTRDICSPSPCGPNSQCREVNGQAVCSCVPNFIGTPPNCRPECVISAECPQNQACTNQKCRDPCPGTCGIGALCQVVNHNPICSCPPSFTGDPFTRCRVFECEFS